MPKYRWVVLVAFLGLWAALPCRAQQPVRAAVWLPGFWRLNPEQLAKVALVRGDSMYTFLHLNDSSVLFLKMPESGGFEMAYADIRDLQASDLDMDSVYMRVHGDSVFKFLDRYNRRMLLAHMLPALCAPDSREAICEKAAR